MEVECPAEELRESVGPILEAVSKTNTIKMGDFIVPVLSAPLKVEIGDTLTVTQGSKILLNVQIR